MQGSSTKRTWLITGCSSGIGRALCEAVLGRGERVVATARNTARLSDLVAKYPAQVTALRLDVTDPLGVIRVVDEAIARTGGIDVLVNNAGFGTVGALEETDERAVRDAFETNVYGPYRMARAILPHMRERKRGHILNVSSMTGFAGVAGFCFYSATKFALEGMSEALAQEIAPFGLKLTIVEPGPFRTDFRKEGSLVSAAPLEAYANTVGKFRQMLADTDGKQPGDPRRAAGAMIAVVDAKEPPLRLPLGEPCVNLIRKKLGQVSDELEKWLPVSLATAFEQPAK
ncbi:MAG: SDR family NAD(P)-dependent oxidoreductase [Proteobacteria bacterium]|nr:SDR family NAD(P)-dependent oxidoreductase [Pseudomonadota bacterium]